MLERRHVRPWQVERVGGDVSSYLVALVTVRASRREGLQLGGCKGIEGLDLLNAAVCQAGAGCGVRKCGRSGVCGGQGCAERACEGSGACTGVLSFLLVSCMQWVPEKPEGDT